MNAKYWFASLVVLFTIIGMSSAADSPDELRARAERFFRGVYGGDSSVVDELAADKILISYPIFAKIFKKNVIRGRDEVKTFAAGFGSRWSGTKISIHESLVDGNKVVLIWTFGARRVGGEQPNNALSKPQSWGGISFFRFDNAGKIVEEIGEESEPGPFGRLNAGEEVDEGNQDRD
jgi:hypothetical protein